MKTTTLAFAAMILALAAPLPTADAAESFGCHDWDVYAGDRSTGAGASTTDGALFLGAEGFYVVSDGLPGDFLFSIWIYQESNGVEGLQRGDEACNETNDEYESDAFCIC